MRTAWMIILAGLGLAVSIPAAERTVSLSGTWALDPERSDSGGQPGTRSRIPSFPGGRTGLPGIGGYPGGGYPGTRGTGGYPGGRDGNDPGDTGEGIPRGQMQDLTLLIVQTENEVQATRNFTVNGKEQAIAQTFALDGSQSSNPASNGRGEFVSRSTWKIDKLINLGTRTTTLRDQTYDITVKEEYSISKDGRTLTIKTSRTTPRGGTSSKQVFNKREPSPSEPPPSQQ